MKKSIDLTLTPDQQSEIKSLLGVTVDQIVVSVVPTVQAQLKGAAELGTIDLGQVSGGYNFPTGSDWK
jgi:hypothetical protein